ncbi:MAG: hypothetical protein WC455_12895 [Dehalococcoidia bacterium]|jgi:hypothetical protein
MTKDNYEGGLELEIGAARNSLKLEIKRAQETLNGMSESLARDGTPGWSTMQDGVNVQYARLRALQQALALYREGKA